MGDRWGMSPTARRAGQLVAACILVLAGCATVPQSEHDAALARVSALETQLEELQGELRATGRALTAAEAAFAAEQEATAQAQADLTVALSQLGALREERQELLEALATLEAAIDSGGAQRVTSNLLQNETAARTPESTRADALAGRGGFLMTGDLGLRNMPRVANRFAAAAPGIAADLEFGVPRLFDARLDYEETAVFLTITNPAGETPALTLHVQYGTDEAPLYVRSVFISIEGRDPVDPIDPIVLSGDAIRRTDGDRLLETITTEVTGTLADRLTTMVRSSRFTVTFVGTGAQHTHRPSVSERSALSNILFAYYDLAGRGR